MDAASDIELAAHSRRNHWTDYVSGVAATLIDAGVSIPGCDIWIDSDVPIGAGVSSSAALEVAAASAFAAVAGHTVDGRTLARWAQKAENDYVGMPCGIMDQFASANGVEGSAILLDCRSLEAQPLPLPQGHDFVLINSMVRHTHATGEYRQRREDCELAARILQVTELRDVNVSDLPAALAKLPEGAARRCRHVVTEIERARASASFLRTGNVAAVGLAMNESHASLRDDMQVSVERVDQLVAMTQATPGVAGARMMGGGFGGCVLALVQSKRAAQIRDDLTARYGKLIGERPDAFICRAVAGAREIML